MKDHEDTPFPLLQMNVYDCIGEMSSSNVGLLYIQGAPGGNLLARGQHILRPPLDS